MEPPPSGFWGEAGWVNANLLSLGPGWPPMGERTTTLSWAMEILDLGDHERGESLQADLPAFSLEGQLPRPAEKKLAIKALHVRNGVCV